MAKKQEKREKTPKCELCKEKGKYKGNHNETKHMFFCAEHNQYTIQDILDHKFFDIETEINDEGEEDEGSFYYIGSNHDYYDDSLYPEYIDDHYLPIKNS